MKNIASKIKTARESAGLTQEEFAAKVGYSKSAIQKFEAGRRTPPARAIAAIINAVKP